MYTGTNKLQKRLDVRLDVRLECQTDFRLISALLQHLNIHINMAQWRCANEAEGRQSQPAIAYQNQIAFEDHARQQ